MMFRAFGSGRADPAAALWAAPLRPCREPPANCGSELSASHGIGYHPLILNLPVTADPAPEVVRHSSEMVPFTVIRTQNVPGRR